ncbi:M20/M25/M40 family metallo-hydrolase [Sphingomonas jatrophae]|uniref:Acetylornithine deacetylase/Succinyl-diaminopimelate desuccinylase n=1 Tax=Sphingomonas jatrophae TaxID=1166337 RepID=A0A1I6LB15_9SPHN|nr:M20/M25/M40 family metallo-hydrolase [Sphingomonas jatrophae]SFS00448.1 Acetylornithine deacetylase/Succinyl-diaminopimelate desuccinylase [Sphingomonas jatrophae]
MDTSSPASPARRDVLRGAALGTTALAATAAGAAGTPDTAALRAAVKADHDVNIKRLQDWIALPTIAAEGRNIDQGVAHMTQLARDAGFQTVETIKPAKGIPAVFATMDNGAKKTLGLYFMYDVKQFDPAEWSSPPLEGRIVDRAGMGKVLIGRGATNQKGPESMMLAALHAFKKTGRKPPVNLVLIAEGEEEIGSPNFAEIVRTPKVLAALKKCSGVIIPFPSQAPGNGNVSVNLGAKGVIELELVASGEKWGRGPAKDLHSSNKAIVDSPAWHLVEALATLVTPDGNTPAIDGWFEHVLPLTPREKALIADSAAKRDQAREMAQMGVKKFVGDMTWQETLERLAAMPTINIEGLVAGYTGPGGKTVLPARAVAKIDMRLVPAQTKDDCVAKLKAHLAKRGFGDIEVNVSGGYDPTQTDENSALIKAELATCARAGIQTTVYPRLAGSWPGYVFTSAPVSQPAGQFGFGHGSGAHAPDEYLLIESSNPKVLGYDDAVMGYVDFLHQIAATG